jgi:hypothetical protein
VTAAPHHFGGHFGEQCMWERKLATKKISNEHSAAIRCGRKATSWLIEEVFLWDQKERTSGLQKVGRYNADDHYRCVGYISPVTSTLRIYQAVRASCVEVLKPQE